MFTEFSSISSPTTSQKLHKRPGTSTKSYALEKGDGFFCCFFPLSAFVWGNKYSTHISDALYAHYPLSNPPFSLPIFAISLTIEMVLYLCTYCSLIAIRQILPLTVLSAVSPESMGQCDSRPNGSLLALIAYLFFIIIIYYYY